MDKKDFFYVLPPELIAQKPAPERAASRMLVMARQTGQISHRHFYDMVSFLRPGDCLVLNDSRVIPARLRGFVSRNATVKSSTRQQSFQSSQNFQSPQSTQSPQSPQNSQRFKCTKSPVEMLLHERLSADCWEVLVKPGKKAKPGDVLVFGDGLLTARVQDITADGLRVVELAYDGPFEPLLAQIGEVPLPHYINASPGGEVDRARYQTVYATHDGSVAAPTAGLHFTDEILRQVQSNGVRIARVTLHVGIGTFRPVKTDDITQHHMHSEYCRITPEQAAIVNQTKREGGRVIAVGTTACRTLESRASAEGLVVPGSGKTDIFIYPGYTFRIIDGLLTNFHLPESTLLMLVSAFAGQERVMAAYQLAINEGYRFYSYGDAMFIL